MLDPEGAAFVRAAIGPLSKPQPDEDGVDPRSPAQRGSDALMMILRRGMGASGAAPTTAKAKVIITLSWEHLIGELRGLGWTLTGEQLTPKAIRRLACAADLIPMVLGSRGEVLDLGHSVRLASPAQRLVLWREQKHCTYQGCMLCAGGEQAAYRASLIVGHMPLDYPVAERTLPNGMRVIVSEDHTVPTVTVNLWVKVGSRHESEGRSGFAHLFEHLMFQGSRNVPSGEHFSRLMAEGGRLNATTWFDRTNYFETVPKGAWELALWLEADRHGHLLDAVTQGNLDNQRDVVKEEKRQRYDNQPYGHALIDIYAAVFPKGHPYHHATIGSMSDLDAASLEDVHAFYRRYYRPNNTVLTLAGDLTADDGFAAAQRYFGPLPAGADPGREPVATLGPLDEPVREERVEEVPNDRLHLAFRLPVDNTEEFLAASLAMDAIGGLATSRLYRRLVRREQLAVGVWAHAMGLVDGVSLGLIGIDVAEGVSADAAEAAACEELEEFAMEGPTTVEMESSFGDSERSWLSALADQEERADLICHQAALHGDGRGVNTYLDRLRQVTAEQVREVAARWLRPQSRAVVAYLVRDREGALP